VSITSVRKAKPVIASVRDSSPVAPLVDSKKPLKSAIKPLVTDSYSSSIRNGVQFVSRK
jgi:hypothetical protein